MTIDPQVRPPPRPSAAEGVDTGMRTRWTAWRERRPIARAWPTFVGR